MSNGTITEGAITVVDQYARQLETGDIHAMMQFAPWARNKNYPMTPEEFELVIRRAVVLGLDPFNPREVQVWKDNHGVHFQISYTLMAEWVERCKGRHTQPQYRELTDEEKKARGLNTNDHAVVATFIMYDELGHLQTLIDTFGTDAAKEMIQTRGIGTVTAGDWAGKFFAPNARDKQFKLEKRALTDAYRHKFGEPGPADIQRIRRERGDDQIEAQDWGRAMDALPEAKSGWQVSAPQVTELAQMETADRKRKADFDALTAEVQRARLARNTRILRGDPEFEGFDTSAPPLKGWDEGAFEAGEDTEPEQDKLQREPPARGPKDLLEIVNGRVEVPYDNLAHLQAGIIAEWKYDSDWRWPDYSDTEGWWNAYKGAMAHAEAKVEPASEAEDGDEAPF